MTSSLFATTVIASFLVVGLPHVLPCPAPRVVYADGEMPDGTTKRKRRRRPEIIQTPDGIVQFGTGGDGDNDSAAKAEALKRECPVPKPGGMLGEFFGFKKASSDDSDSHSQPDR